MQHACSSNPPPTPQPNPEAAISSQPYLAQPKSFRCTHHSPTHPALQEAVPAEEQVALIRSCPAAHAVAALLKPAFLDMRPLARQELLGARISLEGLFKVTREPSGALYEVRLAC